MDYFVVTIYDYTVCSKQVGLYSFIIVLLKQYWKMNGKKIEINGICELVLNTLYVPYNPKHTLK